RLLRGLEFGGAPVDLGRGFEAGGGRVAQPGEVGGPIRLATGGIALLDEGRDARWEFAVLLLEVGDGLLGLRDRVASRGEVGGALLGIGLESLGLLPGADL